MADAVTEATYGVATNPNRRMRMRQKYPRAYRAAWLAARKARYGGRKYECPVCGSTFRRWLHGETVDWRQLCPMCSSQPRHRLMMLWLRRETDALRAPHDLIHFAPEKFMQQQFKALPGRYVSADIVSPTADVHADICAVPFVDAAADIIICNHVLEHIPDDGKAMRELRRLLRPGGWAVLMVPFRPNQPTLEDPSVVDPVQREAMFGQADHVRWYGSDYPDRLRAAGFDVDCSLYWQELGEPAAQLHGLQRDEYLIIGRAPRPRTELDGDMHDGIGATH